MLLWLLACRPDTLPVDTAASDEPPPPFCESSVDYRYDPDTSFDTFPDDFWTVEDASTPTGLRVSMPPDDPAFSEFPDVYRNLLEELGTLDGFGVTPMLYFQFSSAPDLTTAEVKLLVDDGTGFAPVDATVATLDYGRTITVTPWRPLPPGARGVLAVRTDPISDACISPSPALRTLLTDPTVRLADRYADGLAALGWAPEEVGAMVVFTTQSAETVDAAVAADVASRTIALDAPASCTDEGGWRDCRGTVTVADYRGSDGIVPEGDVEVHSTYALPTAIWLPPATTPGPYPVAMCGHGLGGSKSQCEFLAELAAPEGIAVVAVDAQQHGDHPLRTGEDSLDQIMALFGFTLTPPSVSALVMRDNFRASAWDKLQVVAAVRAGMDVDGDGTVDLDGTRLQYVGASLGGIMGPEFMAWSPDMLGSVLVVPGGGLMNLVLDSDTFGVIASAMMPGDWDEDDLLRAMPLVQTIIDAGDPLTHAAAITRRRADADGPHVALLMAFQDTIVPNSSTAALSQAFAVEGVGTEFLSVPGVTFGPGPLSGNLADGATGTLIEYDETQPSAGADWEPADHSTLHESEQARALMVPFVTTVFAGGTPVITDPYAQ